MTAEETRTHIRYSGWASLRLLDAAAKLDAEALGRDLKVSHRSMLKTLQHIYFADWIWYARVADRRAPEVIEPKAKQLTGSEMTLLQLRDAWLEQQQQWEDWASKLSDADVDEIIPYKSQFLGETCSTVEQIVKHVVNHATLHRGQVMAMFRQLGVAPPGTDMLFYYREAGTA